jgi:hypothetical protein
VTLAQDPGAGPRRPALAQKIGAVIVFGMLLGAVPAMLFSVHVPSELGIGVAQVCAAAAALWAAWESRKGGAFDVARDRTSWIMKYAWTRVPLMALFAFFMTFSTIEDGVLALVTAAAGRPGQRALTVTGVSHSRKRCDHFDVREVRWLLNRALCAPDRDLARGQAGGRLTVFGRQSAFGLNVERYELVPQAER